MSPRQKGLLITGLGVLFLTPDSLLVRLIRVDAWTLLFWRGLLMCLGVFAFLTWRGEPLEKFRRLGPWGIASGVFLGSSTTCFVSSLQYTAVANTLVIIAASPLMAGLFSWLFLGESVERRVWVAILVGMAGVGVTMSGGLGLGSAKGDLLAVGSAVSMAAHYTCLRAAKTAGGPAVVCVGGLLAATLAFPFAEPGAPEGMDLVWLPLLGLVVLPVAFGLMSLGPRYLSAPEVSLFLLGETALGPLWVWLALDEAPTTRTLIGGAIVVGALMTNPLLGLTQTEPSRRGSDRE